jgi:WD40 repeat protein
MFLPSPNKRSKTLVSLLEPSSDLPWSVDMVSAIPERIIEMNQAFITASVSGKWQCICSRRGSKDAYDLSVWYTPPNASLSDQKRNTAVLSLSVVGSSLPPMVKLASPNSDDETVYVYAIQPGSGKLVLWKLSRKDLAGLGDTATAAVVQPSFVLSLWDGPSEGDDDATMDDDSTAIRSVTALTVAWKSTIPILWVGTSDAKVYYIQQMRVPLSLHVHPVSHTAAPSSSLLVRLWNTVQYHEPDASIVALVPTASNRFLSACENGKLKVWNIPPLEPTKPTVFRMTAEISLLEQLREFWRDVDVPALQSVRVLKATAAADNSDPSHILCLTRHSDHEMRLHWVCFQQNNTVQSAIWLNRFPSPAAVAVLGLCVASNGIAYAALVQETSVVILAMTKDNAVLEADLRQPVVRELLEGSMTPDVVTHGVVRFCSQKNEWEG